MRRFSGRNARPATKEQGGELFGISSATLYRELVVRNPGRKALLATLRIVQMVAGPYPAQISSSEAKRQRYERNTLHQQEHGKHKRHRQGGRHWRTEQQDANEQINRSPDE